MKRLIVCFDGTWNAPDAADKVTNVVKLLRAVPADGGGVPQIVFYDKGVGTSGFCDRLAGGLTGSGLTRKIIYGYRFLGNNYVAGDEIYIFGFSRGAYTARSLAGLIGLAGLLAPVALGQPLDEVLAICRDNALEPAAKREQIGEIGAQCTADVPIKCVGVWDTVGSLGIPGDLGRRLYRKAYEFHDVQLSKQIDVALHAVAIDEKRSAFPPTLWVSPDGRPPRDGQIVEQVWFPGVHSNVGGSYEDSGLSDMALEWMVQRVAALTGLRFDEDYLARCCHPAADGIGYESRSLLYQTSKLYPYQRLIGQAMPAGRGFGEWFRKTFEGADRRNLLRDGSKTINERLHVSALERWQLDAVLHDAKGPADKKRPYRPANLAAVLAERAIPVVDRQGEVMPKDEVPWPRVRGGVETASGTPARGPV